jgi:two-component system, chemotaxis family, chemotaxis protein CheY
VKAEMAMNVLLVDDSAVMRAMLLRTLHMSGLALGDVHQAGNGQEGLELLRSQPVDLVLLDISMPVMRGDEMLEAMRTDPALTGVPVVVVSSERSEERVRRMEALRAVFVHKPFTPEQLRAVVLNATGLLDECHT